MPACCSKELCKNPELPIVGTFQHKCFKCKKVVHNFCRRLDELTDPFAVRHICRKCDGNTANSEGAKERAKEEAQQATTPITPGTAVNLLLKILPANKLLLTNEAW